MCVAAAIAGAGVVGAGASIYGSNKAASAQRNAASSANNLQQQEFNTYQENLAPYQQNGQQALNSLNLLNTPGSNQNAWLKQTPGYQFTLNQGLKAVQNSAASRGLGVSGAAQKGAANYAEGLAGTTYQNQFGNLLSQATLGENAAAGTGSAALTTGQGIGANMVGAGNATAASTLAGTTGVSNALSGSANGLLTQNYLSQLSKNPGQYGDGSVSGLGSGVFPSSVMN